MRKILLAAALFSAASVAMAGDGAGHTFSFSLYGASADTNYHPEVKAGKGFGIRYGYHFNRTVEWDVGLVGINHDFRGDTSQNFKYYAATTDINFHFHPWKAEHTSLYVGFGVGYNRVRSDVPWFFGAGTPLATHKINKFTTEVVLGANVQLAEHVILKFDFRNQMYNAPPVNPGDRSHHSDERMLGIGLGFPFGFGKCPDGDGDGVCDGADKCPDTPSGCKVDAHGCPIDSDGDGVCDSFDQCADTPRGATVDSKGCPICVDGDGDGVCDDKDRCLNTPRGCKVDSNGCPIDSDGDGVCDGLDRCPNTPRGCKVDANGCPADADGDGVCDGLDKCANTRKGVKVDSDGCEIFHIVLSDTHVHFATDKSVIAKKAYPKLNKVAADILEYNQEDHADKKLEVSGHCDSTGQDEHNMKLSRARANSVVSYLIKRKVPARLLVANGYGYHKPIADNATAEGRAMNRRTEVKNVSLDFVPDVPQPGAPKKTVKKGSKK